MKDENYIIKVTLSTQLQVVKASAEEGQNSPDIPDWAKKKKDISFVKYGNDFSIHLYSDLEFSETDISIKKLAKELMYGRCVGQLYTIKGPFRREKGLSFKDKWYGTQYIGIDIDDSTVPMQRMIKSLKMAPTFSMTTLTHMKDGHKNKYHMFYCFDTILRNDMGVRMIIDSISDDVKRVLKNNNDSENVLDVNVFNKSAFLYGNPNQMEFEASWEIYSPSDFYADYSNTPLNSDDITKQEIAVSNTTKRMGLESPLLPQVWNQMHHDIYSPITKIETILDKYRPYYYLHFHTKLEKRPNREAFIIPPLNYIALRFLWENKSSIKGRRSKSKVKKWRNGQHRRRIFRAQLCFVLYIHNYNMHIDQLVYHALAIFNLSYCNFNQDGTRCLGNDFITPRMIMEIAYEMLRKTQAEMHDLIEEEIKRNKKNFIVNRVGAEAAKMSVKKYLSLARKEYFDYIWDEWLELLKPFIKKGWSNHALAEKLEKLTAKNGYPGVKRSPATIGKRVRPLRNQYRKKDKMTSNRVRKNAQNQEKSPILSSLSPQSFPLNNENKERDIESSKDIVYNMGAILSQRPQIEVANDARKADSQRKYEQFCRLYKCTKTDKENKKYIKTKIKISDSTYYIYLRRYRNELAA